MKTTASPLLKARLAGVCQLLEAITATFGQVIVLTKLVSPDSAVVTATNIIGNEGLYWAGFVSSLVGILFHIVWAFLMYDLLKIVNRNLSLIALMIIIVGCAVQAIMSLLYIAPLYILQNGNSFSAIATLQLQNVSLLLIKLNSYAYNIYLVFFGCWCFISGYLIIRSAFLPRILGILLMVSGLSWMIYLYPPLAASLFFPFIVAASAIGEIPLEFWLIVKGVNVQRWKEIAQDHLL
jgi:hypothetical protein